VSEKMARAVGALYGEGMKSVLRAQANSEGGRKARSEILIVSFFESKNYLCPNQNIFSMLARAPKMMISK
jgi:hypothetical protein